MEYLLSPTVEHVSRSDITQRHVIAREVVVGDKGCDGRLEIGWQLVGDLIDVPLDTLVIALQLSIGLRMIRSRQNVPDSHQVQVVIEGSGDIALTVVAQQAGPVGHRALSHASLVHGILYHLDEGVGGHIPLELVGRYET